MNPETITGPDGITWTRSQDRTYIISTDGRKVIGLPEMSSEYLISIAYEINDQQPS